MARVDSHKRGIRVAFTNIPDAPISKVLVNMRGGRKGLLVNSTNLCRSKNRANLRLDAHSNKRRKIRPLVQPSCGKQRNH